MDEVTSHTLQDVVDLQNSVNRGRREKKGRGSNLKNLLISSHVLRWTTGMKLRRIGMLTLM